MGKFRTLFVIGNTSASPLACLEIIRDQAVAIVPGAMADNVRLQGGRRLSADRVVLAVGNFPPGDPVVADNTFYRCPRYRSDPWSTTALDYSIVPQDDILLIGSGLTMIDLVLALQARGHQGTIHSLSRHGLLPHCHRRTASYPPFLMLADVASTLRVLLRQVRREIAAAAQQGYNWRAVIDALRSQTPLLWRSFTVTEKRRFLRHLRPYWDNHRHRIAPAVADTVYFKQLKYLLFEMIETLKTAMS